MLTSLNPSSDRLGGKFLPTNGVRGVGKKSTSSGTEKATSHIVGKPPDLIMAFVRGRVAMVTILGLMWRRACARCTLASRFSRFPGSFPANSRSTIGTLRQGVLRTSPGIALRAEGSDVEFGHFAITRFHCNV